MTTTTADERLSAPLRAILCMVAGIALLTFNDAFMKWVATDYPVGQTLFMRGLFAYVPIFILIYRAGGLSELRVNSVGGQVLRAVITVTSTFSFIYGLTLMPFADAIAIALSSPLIVTALAALVLKEPVGWRRWMGVLIGFVGVLIMVRPGGEAVKWVALFPLAGVIGGALRDVLTRRMTQSETSVSMLFYTVSAVTFIGLLTLPFGWITPQPMDILYLALAGFMLGGAQFFLIETFRYAPISVVAPFKYTNMLWAVVIGYFVWGELPDVWVISGASLVIISGLYVLNREARLKKKT